MFSLRNSLAMPGAAVFAAGLLASQAQAAVTMDFDIVTNQFSAPAMAFEFKDGKFVWDRQPVTTGFRASGSASREWEWFTQVALVPNGKGGKALTGTMPTARNWSHSDSITFPASFLAAYQSNFASYCSKNGGPEKKVFGGLSASFTFIRKYYAKDTVPEVGSDAGIKQINKVVSMPMTVVCGAMPKRVPASAPAVTQLKLYTSPAVPTCGRPVRLIAEFHTNKAGRVNFTLVRHDGERQNASVDVGPAGGGFAKRWSKQYVYNTDMERSYSISVKGQELPAQWVTVKVNCGARTDFDRPDALTE